MLQNLLVFYNLRQHREQPTVTALPVPRLMITLLCQEVSYTVYKLPLLIDNSKENIKT